MSLNAMIGVPCILLALLACRPDECRGQSTPNILVIMADDVGDRRHQLPAERLRVLGRQRRPVNGAAVGMNGTLQSHDVRAMARAARAGAAHRKQLLAVRPELR